jgi:hypothetical protein
MRRISPCKRFSSEAISRCPGNGDSLWIAGPLQLKPAPRVFKGAAVPEGSARIPVVEDGPAKAGKQY